MRSWNGDSLASIAHAEVVSAYVDQQPEGEGGLVTAKRIACAVDGGLVPILHIQCLHL